MATNKEFIETWPLYSTFDAGGFFQLPDSVSLSCAACGKETTWQKDQSCPTDNLINECGFIAAYQCGLCKKARMFVLVRTVEMAPSSIIPKKVQKIGQFPAQSVDIPRDLEKRLGDSARLYKNAIMCRNFNLGIAALAYMRRVIENKTNELIDVIVEQAESYGIDKMLVDAIRAAKDERMTYDQRLHLASEAIPSTLKGNGGNPLAALYGLLSAGLHARSEEECIAIVDEIRDVFEYVFARLRAEIEDRNRMMSKINKLYGSRGAKSEAK
ncbi:MAG TPA: hypothetical protein VG488_07555 [Candidatus Angelobacter sp.]|nr:hypothetical protein [Candidatus Angelobacter sp.]